jgi:hypothetical protein
LMVGFEAGWRVSWSTTLGDIVAGRVERRVRARTRVRGQPPQLVRRPRVGRGRSRCRACFFSNRKVEIPAGGIDLLHVAPTALALLGVPGPAGVRPSRADVPRLSAPQRLTPRQLADRIARGEDLQLVDVREPAEWAIGPPARVRADSARGAVVARRRARPGPAGRVHLPPRGSAARRRRRSFPSAGSRPCSTWWGSRSLVPRGRPGLSPLRAVDRPRMRSGTPGPDPSRLPDESWSGSNLGRQRSCPRHERWCSSCVRLTDRKLSEGIRAGSARPGAG